MKKVLFILSVLLFFAGFQPKGWEIFLCLFLSLLLSLPVIKPGLPEKKGRKPALLSLAVSFFYAIHVFITFSDVSDGNIVLEAVFTLLTAAGTFWFVLNVLSMFPETIRNSGINDVKKNGIGKTGYFILFIVSVINCCFMTQSSPLYPMNYWDDVNCYVTVSRSMAAGKILYKDLFDHKGPLLHFINFPLSFLNHQSYLGVFVLEIIVCFFWLVFALKIVSLYIKLDRTCFIAVLPLAMLTYSVNAFHYGGSTEEFALPLLTLGLYIGLKSVKEKRLPSLKDAFIAGIASGCLFWMKFTLTGFYIGFILFVIIRCIMTRKPMAILKLGGLFIAGVIAVTLPVLSYFVFTGSLSYLYESYFYFNVFVYSGDTIPISGRIPYSLILMFIQLGNNHVLLFFLSLGFIYLFSARNKTATAFVLISYISTYMCLYSGEKPMFYYTYGLACFSVIGWVILIPLIKNTVERISAAPAKAVIAALAVAAFCTAAFSASDSALTIFRKRTEFPQYIFAKTVRESGDPSVLNYRCLDSGFYNAADTVPVCRFFYQVNNPGDFTKAVDEPAGLVSRREVRFVVTKFPYDLSNEGYRLIEVRSCAFTDIHGVVGTEDYYLYELSQFA